MCVIFKRWRIWPCNIVHRVLSCVPKSYEQKAKRLPVAPHIVTDPYDDELSSWMNRRPDDDPDLRENRARLDFLEREADRHLSRAGLRFEDTVQSRKLPR